MRFGKVKLDLTLGRNSLTNMNTALMQAFCSTLTDGLLLSPADYTLSESYWPELSLQSAPLLALIWHLQSVVVCGDAMGPSTYRSALHHVTVVKDLRERLVGGPHSRCRAISDSQTLIAAGFQQKQRTRETRGV